MISISLCLLSVLTDIPLTGAARVNPGHGTRIARGEGGTKVISISLCLLSVLTDIPLTGAARVNPGHGTRIARGLDWYNY